MGRLGWPSDLFEGLPQQMPSLQEIVFVSHCAAEIEVDRRVAGGWEVYRAKAGETFRPQSIPATVEVDPIYASGLEDAPSRPSD